MTLFWVIMIIGGILFIGVSILLSCLFIIYKIQFFIIYRRPKRHCVISVETPLQEYIVETHDGCTLYVYFINKDSDLTIIYFHGNGTDITDIQNFLIDLQSKTGCSIVTMDYRGYGNSGGLPSQKNIVNDVKNFVRVVKKLNSGKEKYLLFGNSLGGSIILHSLKYFMNLDIVGMIIQNIPTSITDLIDRKYKIYKGAKLFCTETWNVFELEFFKDKKKSEEEKGKKKQLKKRNLIEFSFEENTNSLSFGELNKKKEGIHKFETLFISSTEDDVIDPKMMDELYDNFLGPKKIKKFKNTHNGILKSQDYFDCVCEHIKKKRGGNIT